MEPVADINRRLKITFHSYHPIYYKNTNIISILYQKSSMSDIITYKFALLPEFGDVMDSIHGLDADNIFGSSYTKININITFNQKLYELLFYALGQGMTPSTCNISIYVNDINVKLISMSEERCNMRTEEKKLDITKVIFHDPATIVFWNDKTKTVVKCQDEDPYDKEKGLAMCISKKFFGNEGKYYNVFNTYLKE